MAGRNWIIPESAEKPADARIKTGKYVRKKQTPAELVDTQEV
jgi:hypothetical protein